MANGPVKLSLEKSSASFLRGRMTRGLDFLDNRIMFQSRKQNLGVSRAPQNVEGQSPLEASTEYLVFRLWDWLTSLVSRVVPDWREGLLPHFMLCPLW